MSETTIFFHLEIGAARLDSGDSPVFLSLLLLLPIFSLCSSLKEQTRPVPLPNLILWTPHLSFSCPLTSSPPHLTALCLCSSLLPAPGLGHRVLCVGCVDFFSLRLLSSSALLSFLFSSCLCRSHPALSHSSLSTPPFLLDHLFSVSFSPFSDFFILLAFIAYVKPEISTSIAAVAQYMFVCFIIHTQNMMLIMELIEFSRASKVHSAAECLACLVCICWCFLCVCVCFDNINKISVCVVSLCIVL